MAGVFDSFLTLNDFQLHDAKVEPRALRLTSPRGQTVLEPKVMAVLLALAERPGGLWRRDELFERVWPGSPSGEEVLTRAVSLLRKALLAVCEKDVAVVTVPTLGYRLEGRVVPDGPAPGKDAPAAAPSVAVLAFADLSDTGDQAYFADGVGEEIINALVHVEGLKVAGRTSSFAFREQTRDIRAIGAALNVEFVLEGSVRKHGTRVRVTTQLIRSADGFHQWSETFDAQLTDIFDLQDRIAQVVAREFNMLLHPSDQGRLAPRLTISFEAYDLLLRARASYRLNQDEATFARAEAMLREAVEIDPDFVGAWIEIATLNNFASAYHRDRTLKSMFEASRAAVERAMDIAPSAPETIIWSANIRYFEGEALTAFRMAKTALQLAPQNSGIMFSVGHYAACFGYHEEAARLLEGALELDPLDAFAWHTLALVRQNMRQYEVAERHARHAIKLGDRLAREVLAWNAFAQGDRDEAERQHLTLFDEIGAQMEGGTQGRPIWEMFARAVFHDSRPDGDMMRQVLSMQMGAKDYEPSASTFTAVANLGMVEELMAQWGDAYAIKSVASVAMWGDYSWARAFRSHTGFPAFAESRGLAAVWREFGWPAGCAPLPGTDGTDGRFTCGQPVGEP
ncbi:winged helix-turn-helix domain-containing tetratricopeptide repeat protein [Hyphomonas oceanitis]|uniref:OmpR/PhoB-type domain-containing protein n=1 Tax=Hyphomonas oceanitis SCH89 TaxID=1280953 RepID=A0A059G8K7_9PROT|nr:winged helix-turn-helix domain-containing protein [Hyphomonas oceanitis]KDA03192.1 hypothetical protein HOC_06128 [Hyphomonas oceanitis SCH89]